jgi:hypothetical protein
MSHFIKFQSAREAMNYAIAYNRRAVRIILKDARKAIRKGHPYDLTTLQIIFSFAGIQGYPVTCFHKRLQSSPNI